MKSSLYPKVRFKDLLIEPVRNGIYKQKEYHGRGCKIINMGELFGYPRLYDVPMKRVELSNNEMAKSLVQSGDLLFARRSLIAEGAGKCSIVKVIHEPTTFESSIIRARPNPHLASSDYLYYYFGSPVGRELMRTILRQVAVSGITGSDLMELEVECPSLDIQVRTAEFLSLLDDRIKNLREVNVTLESIAQALFKSWFVDFDPVHAKENGCKPNGIDTETAAFFPDSFEESRLGLIPKGWSIQQIGEVVQVFGGGTPSTKEPAFWQPEEYNWVTPKDLSNISAPVLLDTNRKISAQGLSKISSGLLPINTLLMSSRAPIGYLAIAKIPTAINQGFIAIPPHSELSPVFLLLWCQQNMESIKQKANGSTFMEISKSAFRPIPIIYPSPSVANAFTKIASVLFERITENERQAQALTTLRDILLPRLISGQLRLPEIKESIEDAAS